MILIKKVVNFLTNKSSIIILKVVKFKFYLIKFITMTDINVNRHVDYKATDFSGRAKETIEKSDDLKNLKIEVSNKPVLDATVARNYLQQQYNKVKDMPNADAWQYLSSGGGVEGGVALYMASLHVLLKGMGYNVGTI